MNKKKPANVRAFFNVSANELEAVADTESDVTPVETVFHIGNDVEARTDVERKLNRNSVEFVFDTALTSDSNSNIAISNFIVEITEVGSDTGIPAKTRSNFTSPLIDSSEVESVIVFAVVPSEVEFEAVAAKTVLPGEFSVVTLAAANADTEVVLCVNSHRQCKNCYKC